jgi:protease I
MPTITTSSLDGMKVAILVADGFEQVEMTEPRQALDRRRRAHADRLPHGRQRARLESPRSGRHLRSRCAACKGANAEDFDALLLPGGVVNPDIAHR